MNNVRLRVLFFASWYPHKYDSILGVFVRRKAEAVSEFCDVAVIYAMKDQSARSIFELEETREGNIHTVRVYFRTSKNPLIDALLYNVRFLQSYLLAWKTVKRTWGTPDLLHVNVADRAGLPALFFKWIKSIPYVITEHSTPDVAYTKGERKRPVFKNKWFKLLVWHSSAGGSVDSSISLRFLRRMGVKSNVEVIPNVVEIDDAVAETSIRPSSERIKIGLHISILNERKNVRGSVEAAARLYMKRRDFVIHVIGAGKQQEELTARARALDILDRAIIFHGFVSEKEKAQLIGRSDFHVLNSDEEGFSVVAAESLCYGIPVITTDCGGPEDFVSRDNGIIIHRRDPSALTAAMEQMLDTARQFDRERISAEARAKFSADVVARQTVDLYRSAKTAWNAGNTGRKIMIPESALVLDVGSGHQPHRRANILLERYPGETIHRTTQQISVPKDKVFVVGDGLVMPFRDKTFDMVIASHIGEHVDDPVRFCSEMSRVARGGYIETPGPLTEHLMPTASHKWIVTRRGNTLVFRANPVRKSVFPIFFRFFYLNREGYVDDTWKTENPVLRILNLLLLKLWAHVPFAYTRIVWKDTIQGVMISNR